MKTHIKNLFLAAACTALLTMPAAAQPFTTLHSFTATVDNGAGTYTNSDGAPSYAGLILSGNTLYGTAYDGGTNGTGTVFAINTNGTGFTTLHSFSATADNSPGTYTYIYTNSDGANPGVGLILSGNTLYGTTLGGGTNGVGTVFAVNTNGMGFTVLHTFTARSFTGTNSDGAIPDAGLILSGNTLYGTASEGGTNGNGTVFAVNTDGTGFTTLHSFTTRVPNSTNSDGANPEGGLILSGNTLYGTANGGGTNGVGTVFAVNTNGTGFTTLHSFTGYSSTGGFIGVNDGANPTAGLILSGNTLYGTAVGGGINDGGTVFAVNTNGTGFTVLHSFTGRDGDGPYAGLILSGNTLYGTAADGGSSGRGTVFSIWLGPTIQFTASPLTGLSPLTVQFNSTNIDSQSNAITGWNWNFGDGSTSTLQNPSHIYSTNGIFSPTLFATNNNGMAVLGSGPSITVGNFVVNGGFETEDFTGWTLSGDTGVYPFVYTLVDNGSITGITPYSGTYFAALGTSGSLAYLSQTLATVPGQSYLLSLWLNSPDGLTPNEFLVSWNGSKIFDQTNLPAIGWTNLAFTVTATGTSTVLQFGFQDDPSYLGLDGVSVVPVSAAPQLTILRSAANVILTWPTNNTGFTLQSTTNLVPPAVWSTNLPSPVVVNGQNVETNPISGTQMFFQLH